MKRIFLALAVVVLCTALIGGFAYAQTAHTPVTGNKIVGFGHVYDNNQAVWYDPQLLRKKRLIADPQRNTGDK